MREYLTPDFDVTVYEVEDVITFSIDSHDSDMIAGNNDKWWDPPTTP